MKSIIKKCFALALAAGASLSAAAIGWPNNFEGVMLQGFYWDSYQTETKWNKLEGRADELSPYFKLIWVPNSAKSTGGNGYIPIYWFTNHNSDMGSEQQLRSMIATYKAKGTGIIADLVINHRAGATNWTDFPTETWNGQTWHIGPEGICCNDEVAGAAGQARPTGANDTGEGFDGGRDLDHTNANVQNNCKNYAKCLLEDFGYAGFRLDMVKGYSGYYTKMYNQYAKPTYCVGEYWDGSYDAVAAWIESTGGESAAFDFPFKYAVNEAFASGDMTKLVWYENGTTPKPAGMIHHWYQQLAVTFIDNHDTFRDDWNKFNGNWAAANAFMICSPGTPCVFLPHWNACGDQIARMISARNGMGITNTSDVRVLRTDHDCYMAELTGTRGKLVVKIGPAMVSPEGYSDSQIHCSGEDYCIWTSSKVPDGPAVTPGGGGSTTVPSTLYLMGNLEQGSWKTNVGVTMTKSGSVFTANNVNLVAVTGETNAFFTFVTKLASSESDWDTVNSSDRFGALSKDEQLSDGSTVSFAAYPANVSASGAFSWGIAPGTYNVSVDFSTMKMTISSGQIVGPTPTYPENFYLIGHVNGLAWSTTDALEPDNAADGVYKWNNVTVDDCGDGSGYFSFITRRGADWDTEVNQSDRYGAESKDLPLTDSARIKIFPANESASSAYSWKVLPGQYTVTASLPEMKVTLEKTSSGVESITAESSEEAIYYNLQGVRVDNPGRGLYIKVYQGRTFKVLL